MTGRPTYAIRVLAPGDVELVRDMLACFGDAFAEKGTYCSAQPDGRYLEGLLSSECFFAVVALSEDRVVGGLTAYELRKYEQARSEIYIYDLAVLESHRRQGIATAMIDAAKRVGRQRGAWVLFLDADLGDDPAIALYSKLGKREDVLHFDIPPE